ncbi:MAG: hypothetical protein KDA58_10180 [Planctomycetaceae bacterium]|nr:hypothetical protein [Planctomycetaceae bacterium]
MLTIADTTVPPGETLYIAFRLAFMDTLERIALADQLGVAERSFGYLTQVPFLRNVVPPVQLDEMLLTWSRHMACEVHQANLVDESILYAACETAAQVVRTDPQSARRLLQEGPSPCFAEVNAALADRLQKLHLSCAHEGHFLLLSQFQDIPPHEADELKSRYGLTPYADECMFDLLGRFRVSPQIAERARGLLTPKEVRQMFGILRLATKSAAM